MVTPDHWALVDELGRSIPDDLPGKKDGKTVAMFYWTWHESSQCGYNNIVNITEVIKNHPEALNREATGAVDPDWGQPLQPCFWGKPLFDYYRTTDPWVLRKHAEMLADAGVDVVFFDCTNGTFIWEKSTDALLKAWGQARKDGVNTPRIAFLLPFGPNNDSKTSLKNLYAKIYRPGSYKSLWYLINGKPVIMAYPDNLDESNDVEKQIKNFFTFRPGQPDYVNGPGREDQWGWLEVYPQHIFGKSTEQMPVGVAQNATKENGGHCYAFNAPGSFGRSYTDANGQDESEMAYVKGLNFQEQWDRALKYSPKVIWITGWNEWIAGRQPNWPPANPYKPFAFPDEYDSERSRDIEPTAEWGDYGDIYYCQLIENVRKYKGRSKAPSATGKKTVAIGSFEGWEDVGPDFKHYPNNTTHRYHPRHGGGTETSSYKLINNTGRNDFDDARVARDDQNIYFYIHTTKDITASTDKAWMRLFINIDRDVTTGWKGYDFCLNYKNPTSATAGVVSKCTGSAWEWADAGAFEYSVKGCEMEIKVPRALLGATGALDFEFKWSDNMQEEGNILDFYVNGDCAPGGRFNFIYTAE
ncbi:MAG: hypothetical protein KBS78_00015 [Bacteroidales bacterium]|nr:hypothetical protein [Candidatus Cryptobacteroides faecihippi]